MIETSEDSIPNGKKIFQKKDNLKQKAVSSSGWGFLDKGTNVVVQFTIGIILARLLPPADFGLIGLAMIVVGFGQIFVNLGLGPALIQKQDITERHVRIVFTTSAIAGFVLAIIVFASAPLTAKILNEENVTNIVKLLSIVFIIAGFQIPSRALLKKSLDFRHLFYISLAKSVVYGVVTISLALNGYGVWSLIIGNIFQRTVSLIGSYWYVRHSLKPLLANEEILDLFHFGSGMTINRIFNYFALQGDYFLIGRILGPTPLGLYTKAYSLMKQPTNQFVSVLSDVLFPTASKIQNDQKRIRRAFLKTIRIVAFVTIPICMLMVILAPEIIIGLYGRDWKGAVAPLQILAGFGALRATYNAGASFIRAKGHVYSLFGANLVYGLSIIIGVWIGAKKYGLNGAAWAVGIAILVVWSIIMELNCRLISIKRIEIFKALIPGFLISLCTFTAIFISREAIHLYITNYILNFVILLILGFIFLLGSIFILPQKKLYFIPYDLMEIVHEYVPNSFLKWYLRLLKLLAPPAM